MAGIQREIEAILKLAKSVKNETVFQEKTQYKKFKAKKIGGHKNEIWDFCLELEKVEHPMFVGECIFWWHKLFQEKVCTKDEKFQIFRSLSWCYYSRDRFEMSIEYGQKALDLQVDYKEGLECKSEHMKMMEDSCRKLHWKEELEKYLKELLKVEVLRYNKGEFMHWDLLEVYYKLICSQVENKNFGNAKKTIKNLKLFNLHSKDTSDVFVAMGRNGYKTHFPGSRLQNVFEPDYLSELMGISNHQGNNMDEMLKVKLYHLIARICFLKCEILTFFSDRTKEAWAHIHLAILKDIQCHVCGLDLAGLTEDLCINLDEEKIICETIASTIRLSICDPSFRTELFTERYPSIFLSKHHVSYYLGKVMNKYSLDFYDIMPLVDFCIENFDEREIKNLAKMAGTRESWVGAKEKLIVYKNSLFIMQHFQTNLPQVESERKNKVKAVKFALFHDSRYREH
jgi:hypothetical protein